MHVPVQHRDALHAVACARGLDRDRDVGEQAEAHRHVREAVVARRARHRVGVAMVPGQHRVDRVQREAGGLLGDLVAARAEGRIEADLAAALVGQRLEALQVGRRMDALQVLLGGHRRAAQVDLVRKPGDLHQRHHAPLRFGGFGQPRAGRRLHPAAHRCDQGEAAHGAVPEAAFVVEEGGGQGHERRSFVWRPVGACAAMRGAESRIRASSAPSPRRVFPSWRSRCRVLAEA